MKVLFLTNIPSPYRVDFFNELGKQCDLTVLFERNNATNRESKWLKKENYNFRSIWLKGLNFGGDSAISFEVIKYLNKKKFDVIVVGGYSTPTGMLAINYMKLRNIIFGINADGAFIPKAENFLKRIIKKYYISSANFWLSPGKVTNIFFEYYGAHSKTIYTYPFTSLMQNDILRAPIDKEIKERLKEKHNIREKKVILSVGRFVHVKGFDVLIEAANNLPEDFGIYIVGGQPTQEYLELISKLNIKNIHFIDFKPMEELKEYYFASDIFVLPSRGDIWGLVINEAMAYGLPIVTTNRCVAGLELINNDQNGFIVPINNSEKLADRIIYILKNDAIRDKMMKNNLEKIKSYTIENMAKTHMKIFNEIIRG